MLVEGAGVGLLVELQERTQEDQMLSKDFNVKLLRSIPIFSSLTDDDLENMRSGLRFHRCGPGEVVVREGDAADCLYVLVTGEVQVVKNYLELGSQTVDVLRPGSFFGEMALVGEGQTRSATVVTTEESRFLTLDRDSFREVLRAHPAIALAALSEAYRRLRQANEIIAMLQASQTSETGTEQV